MHRLTTVCQHLTLPYSPQSHAPPLSAPSSISLHLLANSAEVSGEQPQKQRGPQAEEEREEEEEWGEAEEEMATARRERRWLRGRVEAERVQSVQPPTLQALFAASPDRWVARSSSLIPLAGGHPFNAEPPLGMLTQSMITPNDIRHTAHSRTPLPHCIAPPLSTD